MNKYRNRSGLLRLLAVLFAFALVAAACGSDDDDASGDEAESGASSADAGAAVEPGESATEPDAEPAPRYVIGLVTDTGKVDDKSFNQSAWEGVLLAADNLEDEGVDVSTSFIETEGAKDYENNINLFVEGDADLIVTVGFGLAAATAVAAADNPDILFIGVDQFVADNSLPNLAGLLFEEAKAGFLAGALAGLLTQTNKVGAVLGTDLVPGVGAFKVGWENGARYTNPDVETISTFHPGGLDTAFSDPEWGATTARQALDQGADIIFGAGGTTGNGAIIEVASEAGALCVGVDTDQWLTVPEARPCLVTSAVKQITPSIADLIGNGYDKTFPAGNYFGDIGLADHYDFGSLVTAEIQATLDEVEAGLADGSVNTGYSPG